MEDAKIVQLYWERNEEAIEETHRRYGGVLTGIAYNILQSREDSEECVNDTYHRAWDSMPPQKPVRLLAYLGRITRNLSINRWNEDRAQKRGGSMLLTELSDCIPSRHSVEDEVDTRVLAAVIGGWLDSLPQEERALFLRRYWFCDSLDALAAECDTTLNKLAGRLYRLRQKLKTTLEQEECI